MNHLKLLHTETTPYVSLNQNGEFEISGKVIPDLEIDFWFPIRAWFNEYMINPSENTCFRIKIDCLNTSSSKEILHILYRLNELKERGLSASVEWIYKDGDMDMLEVGQDYEHMVKVPFNFSVFLEELVD